jgi:hypothetical protein
MAPNTQNSTKSASAITTAEAELQPDERLIWAERAGPGTMALRVLPVSLFGLPFTAFSLFMLFKLLHSDLSKLGLSTLAPICIVVPITLIVGLAIMSAPVFEALKARKTIYAITDRRLLIISDFPQRRVDFWTPVSINAVEVVERANGVGNIIFRKEREWKPANVETGFLYVSVEHASITTKKIGFFGIPEVRKVEEAIRRLVSEGSQVAQ